MNRSHPSRGEILLLALVAVGTAAVVAQLPEIRRYLKMKSM